MKKVNSFFSAPYPHWVGDGFPAKTLFSYHSHDQAISPFLLLDYAGPMPFSPTEHQRGVGEHPHRGFETVTLVYQGELAHKDSTGSGGVIGVGDVQWMTAAKGILHEEFHSHEFAQQGGTLEVVQLWVNLPKRDKMVTPRYQTITKEDIPQMTLADGQSVLRVIAGEVEGLTGPAETHTPMLVMDGTLNAAAQVTLPVKEGWTAIVVLRKGKLRANGQTLSVGQTVIFEQKGQDLDLHAIENGSEVLILAGEPIDEPIVGYGPFVMNSEAEIRQAIDDFQSGQFGRLEHATPGG